MIYLNIAFEDQLSEFVISKLLASFDDKFSICNSYNGRGFGYLRSNINGFNEASSAVPFLILTDLDDAECPANLIGDWLSRPKNPNLIFRVAVREIEAWLLADAVGFSSFTRTPIIKIPQNPEDEADPKNTLIQLVERYGTRSMKEDIVPVGTATIGRNYNFRLADFVVNHWDIERAKQRCDSLRRMHLNLEEFELTT